MHAHVVAAQVLRADTADDGLAVRAQAPSGFDGVARTREGDITLAVRNANYTLGPVMLHLDLKPGAAVPAHSHKGMSEALYVVEGDFINEGKQYDAGTSLQGRQRARPARD
jgi:redox-sensitive bicupin YhaK (pirin superfamily)